MAYEVYCLLLSVQPYAGSHRGNELLTAAGVLLNRKLGLPAGAGDVEVA